MVITMSNFRFPDSWNLAGGYANRFSSNARPGQPDDLDPRTRYYIELGHAIGQTGVYDAPNK